MLLMIMFFDAVLALIWPSSLVELR